ncbi:M20/M25/M40 family metallo-hydrolase [Sphingomonas colocasiae]|uniref:Carboxypeptidase Q n=1 Tax=Sphingomonas colocasiae TaxID=1848973 RepID=A0ABS7PRT6_9SPHN|nr:M20/M25/M40 family metallo-hydrolase [Sphingomonas colocasiae]MBY8823938.1 M20/M25/M40 family metallo-hydrolase [Sphingomonas colocasiae]
MRHVLAALLLASVAVVPANAQKSASDKGASAETGRIIDEGLNHSEVMQTAQYLTDRIGGRMTNSPAMREAEKWTQEQFRRYGLSNVRADPFEFGRGWSIVSSSVRMTSPRPIALTAIPVAWTPGTNGAVSAEVIVAPLRKARDFDTWRGKLAGKIVLITLPDNGSEPETAPFRRLSSEDLGKLDKFEQPKYTPDSVESDLKQARFAREMDAFLKQEGALAWVRMAYRDGKLVHGTGSVAFRTGQTPAVPGIELAAEDYRRLARLAKAGPAPVISIDSQVKWHDEDLNAYNILADIPGSDPAAGYVMAGAHLDSWVAGDGATDNAAGSAVIMEAARILAKLGVRPKRTIRFALWSGEEQGLRGSLAYVGKYLANFPPIEQGGINTREEAILLRQAWPITPKAGHKDLGAYFNMDNGSGRFRGIYAENNPAVVPIFKDWLAPFASMGANTVAIGKTGATDHVYMQYVGLPGFQFIQDPLDYGSRTHHSNADTFDHLKPEDLRQNAVILASMLLNAANRAEGLPRPPFPTKPTPTDPFGYRDDRDD